MKDLSLSLLSRGCGRVSASNGTTGGHNGRLDVCFTPRDYYIWQSKETLLRLSSSGHLFTEAESGLPKTYSTRRGPLLLYSQDLVAMEPNLGIETGRRKKRVVRRDTQEVQQHLKTLKELTAALLSFSNNQYISSRLAAPLFPPFQLPPAPKLHCPSPLPIHATRAQPSSEMEQWSRQWLDRERKTEVEKLPQDPEEEQDNRKEVRLDLFLQMPSTSRTATPQTEPQPWVHYVAMTPKEPVEPQTYMDSSLQPSGGSEHTELNPHRAGGGGPHQNMKRVHDAADDQGSSLKNSGADGDENMPQTSVDGSRHGSRETGLLHPPLDSSVSHRPFWEKENRPRRESPSKHQGLRLPPIAEAHYASVKLPTHSQTQQDVRTQKERISFKSQENPARLHQQPLTLLPLPPETEEVKEKQREGREQTRRQSLKQDLVEQRRKGTQPSEKGSAIPLQPDGDPAPPVGGMGGVVGWKGPGKQSSLAYLHHLHDPCGSSDPNPGVVRGVLPLKLRDFHNKKSVGSLILGPDGEIVQLSLYDTSQDPSQHDANTRQKALQVLSAEGEELPWVIVVQPEHANTEGGEELNNRVLVDDIGETRHLQSVQKGAEGQVPRRQVAAARFSTERDVQKKNLTQTFHLDHHQSIEADAPSIHTDPMTRAKKKRKKTKAVTETWEESKQDAKNKVRMRPMRERVGKGKIGGGNTEKEEEEEEEVEESEEEEDGEDEEQTSYSYGSNQSGGITRPTDSTTRHTVDKKRKNAKKRAAEEAVITAGKRDVKSTGSDGPRSARKTEKRQRKKTKSGEAQSIRSDTEEEETSGETVETQEVSEKKKKKNIKGREGERGEVKMNGDREDPDGETSRRKEATSRRKRRGKGKHKKEVAGSPAELVEGDEEESNPEMQESHRRSTRRSSASQEHGEDTTTEDDTDTDTDCVSTNDRHSSIHSVTSHRSTVASSPVNPRSSWTSGASSFEGRVSASVRGLAASRGRGSSCSTVMITEDQLMLNPMKPEFPRSTKSPGGEDAALLRRAQRGERWRQEEERKRREQEDAERKKQQKEQTEDKMKNELEEERRKRAEGLRLKKLAEEEEGRRLEEEEQERARREQAQRERERRSQEQRRRQMEQLHRMRKEEEQRMKDKLERLRLEEEKQQEEENRMLQEMDEGERTEYLTKKKEEQEERRRSEEEQRRREEEAAVEARLQAELLSRQVALLQRQLAFKQGLWSESEGLEKTQCISRPWIYSYFDLLQLLGPIPSKAGTVTP